MKKIFTLLAGLFCLCAISAVASELLPQRVLYVGHRAAQFEPFLKSHFTKVESVSRENFTPSRAKDFDVVLLDWPQNVTSANQWDKKTTPLGKREEWSKPTVLLGSAGLNLAVAWKLKGGSGCTCLAPVAYDLRQHDIFKSPIPIDTKATVNISTPKGFTGELKAANVDVLPLVDGIKRYDTVIEDHERGWSTHYFEFADMPEVEIFSGGINEQTPASSAFWRQGNLLHFGFEQSPDQLNAAGRGMLVNGIVYISHFSEDRPIDVTPSVFGNEQIGISRRRAKNYLSDSGYRAEWASKEFAPAVLASFDPNDVEARKAWVAANGKWLHPGAGNRLEIDAEAKSLGIVFDNAEFLPKCIAALRDEKVKATAAVLLVRYAPDGPGANADAGAWDKWWRENSLYLFYSELGCYRWYIDPLAKKRGIPTKDLRGPARADISAQQNNKTTASR